MAKKIAQIQFIQQQIEELEYLKCQTDLNRSELVSRVVDCCILQVTEHRYWSTLIPVTPVGIGEAR